VDGFWAVGLLAWCLMRFQVGKMDLLTFLAGDCRTSGATVLRMAYGYAIATVKPDVLVEMVEKMMMEFSLAAAPMSWAADIVPALQHVPAWLPGAGFQRTARKFKKSIDSCAWIPYWFVKQQLAEGRNQPSYVSRLIESSGNNGMNGLEESGNLSKDDENAIVWTAASLYGAAADTTVITLKAFTLAMLRFPKVQGEAQRELDQIIGSATRLPALEDRPKLPYMEALLKESLRWWPIAPMGFPHTVTAPDGLEYRGMHIPHGALLLPAVWSILRDKEVYPSPDEFQPVRFLAPRNEPDPNPEAFGYGRRACAGRHFAEASLWLNMATTLAFFSVRKPAKIDETVFEADLASIEPKPGVLSYMPEFPFAVEVRSEKHAALLRTIAERDEDGGAGDSAALGDLIRRAEATL
jgi:fumagillin biosynthesis cytochrome P450 monooxygenase